MSWPDDGSGLPIAVLAAFGADLAADPITWQFTDLSDRARQLSRQITVRRGASDGAPVVSPGTGTATVGNDDGALTPQHPGSPFWPAVDLNVPVAMGVLRSWFIGDSDSFATNSTNSWGLSDRGLTWQTISAGGTIAASDYQVTGGVGTHSVPAANAYRATWLSGPVVDVDVVCTVTAPPPTGAPIEPCNVLARITDSTHYYMARLSVATSGAVTASIHASGGTGQLASVVVPGLTWSGSQPVRVRLQCWGEWIRMRVWKATDPEPTAWTLWTESAEYTAAGGIGVRSGVAASNTNTKPVVFSYDDFAATELPAIRLDGFADGWEPTYVPVAGGDVVSSVRLTASGLLRRLTQGSSPEWSALRRALSRSGPVAYWPLEDGEDSTQAASGILGGAPLTVLTGEMDFTDQGPPGSAGAAAPHVDVNNGLSGPIVGGSATAWQMSVWTRGVAVPDSLAVYIPAEVRTSTGQILRFGMQADQDDTALILQYPSETATSPDNYLSLNNGGSGIFKIDGRWHLMQATFRQSGGNTLADFYLDDALIDSGVWAGVTIGAPVSVSAVGRFGAGGNVTAAMTEIELAHLAVHNTDAVVEQYQAGLAYVGELASDRIARICAEEGISARIDAGTSEVLGPQTAAGPLDIMRDAAVADMGILSEYRWGLRYRPRSARYNLDPVLTVDLSTYQRPSGASAESILAPVYDDQTIRNDVTASRPNGSSARYRDEAHVARYGLYDDSVDVNVATDSRLPDQAGWRGRLGTWQEMRYPSLPLHLEGNPDLIDDWLALELGDRVDRINPPPQHPPGPISQIIPGYTEVLAPKAWTVTASCLPYGPWEVAEVDGDQRVAADGSTVGGSGLALGAMSFTLVSTAANGAWTTSGSDFPLDLNINGERATASAITGTGLSQTVNLSARGVNGITKAHAVGAPVDVWAPAIVAL